MTMSGCPHGLGRGWRWRRSFAPLVVLLALLADYASPVALWTAALPLMFMAVLLTFRERTAALLVLCLSSWILLPVAAGARFAIDTARGEARLYSTAVEVPGLPDEIVTRCRTVDLPVVPLAVPPVLSEVALTRQVTDSIAAFYNQLTLWNAVRRGTVSCAPMEGDLSAAIEHQALE